MKPLLPFLLLVFAVLSSVSVFSACEKEPETITKTIIERDTIVITSVDTVYLTETDTVTLSSFIHDTATTFICLRHAETTGVGTDPVLSTIGLARAETLKRIMGNVALKAVYSTDYNRTRQTAAPTATDKGLSVQLYNPANLNGLADGILASHHGEAVLVLGHSNTTPSLLNVLVGQNLYANLPETEYDNLFMVTVFEKGRANVLHLKYGE
jgi:phosphohistidine phosphatase SixA